MKNLKKFSISSISIIGLVGIIFAAQAFDSEINESDAISKASVSIQSAIEIAVQTFPGSVVFAAELEKEDGQLVWEVEVLSKAKQFHELEIDAETGMLLSQKMEKDAPVNDRYEDDE